MRAATGLSTKSDKEGKNSKLPAELPMSSLVSDDAAAKKDIGPSPVPGGGKKPSSPGVGEGANISKAITQKSRFYYMSSDSLAVHGLKDWSGEEWAKKFERHPQAATKFCMQFIGGDPQDFDEAHERLDAARQVKARMDDAMEGGEWQQVVRFQNYCTQKEGGRQGNSDYYMEPSLFWNYVFDRDFPLGVEDRLVGEPWHFAVEHSGIRQVGHAANSKITAAVYLSVLGVIVFAIFYVMRLMVGKAELWKLKEGTEQDKTNIGKMQDLISDRTQDRGTVASCLQSLSFSLMVNALLDKYGRIDPSTSTVFIGMTLGGTFGFIMDNQLGSDEGFREYLWAPTSGMKYAMGALATARYGRYLITIIFDMFFTVILFKLLYSKLVRLAGFSTHGREWIANGMVSCFISIITYQVYANMTRFEWAYPSGVEDTTNQWISGQTMILNVVIMNMVYLVTETRVKVGEKGINDPPVKVGVTMITYLGLFLLQDYKVIDPSVNDDASGGKQEPLNHTDYHLPLPRVCETVARWSQGAGVFTVIATLCLGFVIFVTSKQTLSGLKHIFCRGPPPPDSPTRADYMLGKMVLFVCFLVLTGAIMLFFATVPLYSAGEARRPTIGGRDWVDACMSNDVVALEEMGLS